MSCAIIIRDYRLTDNHSVQDVLLNAYLSNVANSWYNAIIREITFQLIVMSAALLYIVVGVPFFYCVFAIPLVLVILYVTVYFSWYMKALELVKSKRPVHCWVAEAWEPLIFLQQPKQVTYRILPESTADAVGLSAGSYKKKVIGTVAVSNHLYVDNAAWLFRLAVDSRYCHKGIAHALVQTTQKWCRNQGYRTMELAMSECQDVARKVFVDTGFEIKQLYHQQLIGSTLTLLMYQLSCDLRNLKPHW